MALSKLAITYRLASGLNMGSWTSLTVIPDRHSTSTGGFDPLDESSCYVRLACREVAVGFRRPIASVMFTMRHPMPGAAGLVVGCVMIPMRGLVFLYFAPVGNSHRWTACVEHASRARARRARISCLAWSGFFGDPGVTLEGVTKFPCLKKPISTQPGPTVIPLLAQELGMMI